jgi:hypothetical protein
MNMSNKNKKIKMKVDYELFETRLRDLIAENDALTKKLIFVLNDFHEAVLNKLDKMNKS